MIQDNGKVSAAIVDKVWACDSIFNSVIPLVCLQLSWEQPSSTATVDIRPTPQLPLPQPTPALPKVISSQVRTPTKKQAKKVIAQKHPPKTQAKRKKNRANTRPYTAPAIETRVAIAQNVSSIAIASSTEANIVDGNGQHHNLLVPNQSFQAVAFYSQY